MQKAFKSLFSFRIFPHHTNFISSRGSSYSDQLLNFHPLRSQECLRNTTTRSMQRRATQGNSCNLTNATNKQTNTTIQTTNAVEVAIKCNNVSRQKSHAQMYIYSQSHCTEHIQKPHSERPLLLRAYNRRQQILNRTEHNKTLTSLNGVYLLPQAVTFCLIFC